MIQLIHVGKTYRTPGGGRVEALKDVSLHIPAGSIYGIIGLSGAGKSTLIRCINRLEHPEGQILIAGHDITQLKPAALRAERRKIGMIFQHFNLLASRTVAGNVAFPLEIAGVRKAEIEARVKELLELVGLSDKAGVYPSQLSGGQKQRVGIARALANQPQVLLCDEATSALDPQTTKSILDLLRDINRRMGLTIVLITHEMAVIKEICDQVAVIEGGVIVETGPVSEVFANPRTETARALLSGIIGTDVPDEIKKHGIRLTRPGTVGKLVHISFLGEAAGQPVISSLVRKFGIDVNILSGNIDHLKDVTFGTLVVELIGPPPQVQASLDYLKSLDLRTEVLGHVESDAAADAL